MSYYIKQIVLRLYKRSKQVKLVILNIGKDLQNFDTNIFKKALYKKVKSGEKLCSQKT